MNRNESIKKAECALEKHRNESFITCQETCLCWDLEALIEYLLESKPEPTEFTKELRQRLRYQEDCGKLEAGVYKLWIETCGEIDRLNAENKELKSERWNAATTSELLLRKAKELEAKLKAKDKEIVRLKRELEEEAYCPNVNDIDA